MRRFEIRPEAVEELSEAATWYANEAAPGLGAASIADYDFLASGPSWPRPQTAPRFRAIDSRGSNDAILMAEIAGVPTVLAVECSSRKPGYWRDRLQ